MWTILTFAVAVAAPKPSSDLFTADRLAGRWHEVGRPEQCEAGAHVFRHMRDPYYVRYENSAGRYAPSVGKVGVPDYGYGALGELRIGSEYRSFRFDHGARGASGQLVIVPAMPTPEEKKLKQAAWYDLVKCSGDWPEARRPQPGTPVTRTEQMGSVTVAWLVGAWGETGFDFQRSTGWFATRCEDRPELPAGVVRVGADGAQTPTTQGALLIEGSDGASVTGWSTLWGVEGFFGSASAVRLPLDGPVLTAPDGARYTLLRVSDDRMVWADAKGVPTYAFERCK